MLYIPFLIIPFVFILFLIYRYPWVGILALLTIPLVKVFLRANFPFLVGYTYDMGIASLAIFACWVNFRRTYTIASQNPYWGRSIVVLFYILLLIAVLTISFTRNDTSAFKKILYFGIFTQIMIVTAVTYLRTLNDLRLLFNIVIGVAVASIVMIFIFPISAIQDEVASASEAVLGSSRLSPSNFLGMASIILWCHYLENTKLKRWWWLILIFMLGVLATGTRGPVLFVPLIFLLSLIVRKELKIGRIIGFSLPIVLIAWIVVSYSTFADKGISRLLKLSASLDEARVAWPMKALRGWWERSLEYKIFGGGLADSAYSLTGNSTDWKYPHNWIVEFLVELGPIGMMIFLVIVIYIVIYTYRIDSPNYSLRNITPFDRANISAAGWIGVFCILNIFKTGTFSSGYIYWFFFAVSIHIYERFYRFHMVEK